MMTNAAIVIQEQDGTTVVYRLVPHVLTFDREDSVTWDGRYVLDDVYITLEGRLLDGRAWKPGDDVFVAKQAELVEPRKEIQS
jgi:hypothetical protein